MPTDSAPRHRTPSPEAVRLGKTMKRWRERRGVSVRELARRIAIDPGSVLLLEAGQQEPRYDHLRRIARALDLRVSVQFAPKKSPAHH